MKELRISMDQSSEKKVLRPTVKGTTVGLTDINEFQYKQLKKLWGILRKEEINFKFDKIRIKI
tara:strand:- start:354 stop:542 length:189 start_codon:yes stop_codon:yes gene_type:complete